MLDPRIYRAGFVAVAVAVVVFAFSLDDQPAALSSSLAPDAFNAQNVYSLANKLAAEYPQRQPGSAGDDALAGDVAQTLGRYGFAANTTTFRARTATGRRTLETVTGTRFGLGNGTIVIVAHRDSLASPAASDLTGTAALLELARVLSGETHNRTIVLASTSGSAGAAGASQLAHTLGGGVDAVIALGDLGAAHLHDPLVDPWSDGLDVTPLVLRNTLTASLSSQIGFVPGGTSLAGQLVHLAFPLTLSEQGPFGGRGIPAALLSASGERDRDPNGPISLAQLTAFGSATLETISALDGSPSLPAASPYLLYDSKVIPFWAVRLLVLCLILPVLVTTVDGMARAGRRGAPISRWLAYTLGCAVPFGLTAAVAFGARALGLIGSAPPEPVPSGAIPPHAGGIALLVGLLCVLAASLWALGHLRPDRRAAEHSGEHAQGAGAAALLVMCLCTLAIWYANPFAALLTIPALHLWMWLADPETRIGRAGAAVMLAIGLTPPLLVIVYYAVDFGYGPLAVLWNGLLLIAGGHITITGVIEWCVLLGCTARVISIGAGNARRSQALEEPVTIRGPVGYAGPGSLGGTESALRR